MNEEFDAEWGCSPGGSIAFPVGAETGKENKCACGNDAQVFLVSSDADGKNTNRYTCSDPRCTFPASLPNIKFTVVFEDKEIS